MSKLKHPIFAAVCFWDSKNGETPMTTIWDYELLKGTLPERLEEGTVIDGKDGIKYKILRTYLSILDKPNENKYGVDFSQMGDAGVNNVVINIVLTRM